PVIGRTPTPIATIVWIIIRVIPAAAPTEAPATPTQTKAEPTVPAVTVPWVEPRVVVTHARCIVVKAIYAVGIFAVAVFVGIIVIVVTFVRIIICIVPLTGILFFLRGAFVIVIIGALVVDFPGLRVIVIDVIAERYLPGGAT